MAYVNLVLSGGGQRCLAFVGFLRVARPMLSAVRNVYCVSGGAIAGLAFCLRLGEDAVLRSVSRRLSGGVRADIGLLLSGFGLDDVRQRLGPLLVDLIVEARGSDALRRGLADPPLLATPAGAEAMTFADLTKATGMNLVVHAVSVLSGEVRLMSVDSTPNARVVDAVCASCAVPLFFCPVRVEGDLLVDGCLAESYPFRSFASHAAEATAAAKSPPAGPSEASAAAPSPALRATVPRAGQGETGESRPAGGASTTVFATDTLVLSADFVAAARCAAQQLSHPGQPLHEEQKPPEPASVLDYAVRVLGIFASRCSRGEAVDALGPRARVFRVNAACEVTASRVICDGLSPAAVSLLYRAGLDEGHRFMREEETET
jgi:predicted acylesterase/phospholipase RssA